MTSSQLSCVKLYLIPINSAGVHIGTWRTLIESLYKWKQISLLMTRMERKQATSIRQGVKWPLFYESSLKRWFLRFPSNCHYIRLSQSDRGKRTVRGEPALAITEWISPGGLLIIILILLAFIPVFYLVRISCVRNFLVKSYRGDPTHEMVKNHHSSV